MALFPTLRVDVGDVVWRGMRGKAHEGLPVVIAAFLTGEYGRCGRGGGRRRRRLQLRRRSWDWWAYK